MNPLETAHLQIIPLSEAQLKMYYGQDGRLEANLGLDCQAEKLPMEVVDALENHFLPLIAAQPHASQFYTLWVLVQKDQGKLVGDLCFKGPPSEEGQVEIGYSTHKKFQNQGYMTQAVAALLDWCKTQSEIKTVLAETEFGNLASEKVLVKNAFTRYFQSPDSSWWEKKVQL